MRANILKTVVIGLTLLIVGLIVHLIIMPLYVHLGDEIKMPDVVENNLNEATHTLESKGFIVHIADSVFDAHYPAGTIVEQMPIAFSTVKEGRNVYLTISNGEKPIIMPNVFGLSPRAAKLKLEAASLILKEINYDYMDLSTEGAVISQSFPQGQEVRKNTEISITVSLGPMPSSLTVPYLIGKSLSAARQQLRLLKLRIGKIEYEENSSYLPNTILKQSMAQGASFNEESRLDLVVTKLEARAETEE